MDLSSTQGALCTVSVFFILHFTYFGGVAYAANAPPAYGPDRLCQLTEKWAVIELHRSFSITSYRQLQQFVDRSVIHGHDCPVVSRDRLKWQQRLRKIALRCSLISHCERKNRCSEMTPATPHKSDNVVLRL